MVNENIINNIINNSQKYNQLISDDQMISDGLLVISKRCSQKYNQLPNRFSIDFYQISLPTLCQTKNISYSNNSTVLLYLKLNNRIAWK